MFEAIRKLLGALDDKDKRGWTLRVNGQLVEDATEVELESRFGLLRWGKGPAGYDQWGFEEPGGGGSVLVPFFVCKNDKAVWVGVVRQPRPFQCAEPVDNLPRGFLEPGQSHFQTALREGGEEVGFTEAERISALPGDPGNPNSTFFVTLAGGVRFFGVRFSEDEMTKDGSTFVFKPGVVQATTKDAEKIMGCRFISWIEAMKLGDLFTNAGVGRLLASLVDV